LVVLSKMDLPELAEWAEIARQEFEKLGFEVFCVSAVEKKGLEPLLERCWELLHNSSLSW